MSFTIICRTCQQEFTVDSLEHGAPWCADCSRKRAPVQPEQSHVSHTDDRDASVQEIAFRVDYQPYPQPRPRVGSVPFSKKCPTCQHCATRPVIREADDDHPIHAWKMHVRDAWLSVKPAPGWKFQGPIALQILLVLPRLKDRKGKARYRPTVGSRLNGDADNYAKGIMDALNNVAWRDDAQICNLLVDKWAAAAGEDPYAVVTIEQLEDPVDGADRMLFELQS